MATVILQNAARVPPVVAAAGSEIFNDDDLSDNFADQSFSSNFDDSRVAIHDRNANDVIPDFLVLLPVDSTSKYNSAKMTNFMDKERIIPPIPRLLELYVPLLVEVKHAAMRHANITQYQVKLQGDCLFCSPKFANQTKVLLVTATGEWILAVEFEETQYTDVQDKSGKFEFKNDPVEFMDKLYHTSNTKMVDEDVFF
ncbi:hypothetical protein BDQ17DRAFT_1334602 [Cyathus striatus]|nr:hypothetical protein BDQ17DRAFT_1334602 [Cyathus striatus]